MTIIAIHMAVAIWWSIAVCVILANRYELKTKELLVGAVFWPLLAVMYLPVVLWRIPFKTTKAIRIDLRNRRLLGEFEEWLKTRNDTSRPGKTRKELDDAV